MRIGSLLRLVFLANGALAAGTSFWPSDLWRRAFQLGGIRKSRVTAASVLISEYVSGASDRDQAIELTNYGSVPQDLKEFSLRVYLDGRYAGLDVPTSRIDLGWMDQTMLDPGDSVVIVSSGFSLPLHTSARVLRIDLDLGAAAKAVGLFEGPNLVDSLGQVGSPLVWGSNITLSRIPGVEEADASLDDTFDYAALLKIFKGHPANTVSGLGCTSEDCTKFTEFMVAGLSNDDTTEIIEGSTVSAETATTISTETFSTDATSTDDSTETFSTESTETVSTETFSTDATFTEESPETFSTESTETFTTESTDAFSTESAET
ncbi:MAG: hypothetical protein KVP17_004833, partial [Porospora cf. gigantea B]|uniref:uncharacterized protein n=1 Tax=Porospora cf. gigantea B TaxID=2853592 RepID=UPI003571D413